MSLFFPPHLSPLVSFPRTLSSPPAPTSPPSASSTSTARIRQRSPCASACHWRESGPLTDFAPNTFSGLQGPERYCGTRISCQESKRRKSLKLQNSVQHRTVMALYDQEIARNNGKPNYKQFKNCSEASY